MPWEKSPFSSNVSSVRYDEETQTMTVRFQRGGVYAYMGVPEDVALQLINAASVTQMLNTEIKPNYSYRRLA